MSKLFRGGIALAALLAAPSAMAADLKAPLYKAPPPVYLSSWTGFYLGIGLGWREINNDWNTTATFFPGGAPFFFTTDPNPFFSNGAGRVSIYGGYNLQVAPTVVIGVEADYGWADNHSTLASIPGLGVQGFGSFTDVRGRWDGSVRGRAGYLITPMLLAYGTAGVAFQRVEETATCPADTTVCNPAFDTVTLSNASNRVGYTVGGGLEAMFGHFLARAEYRYANYGTFSFTAFPAVPNRSFGANADLITSTHTVTVGLAYKFDGFGPVVANY